MTRERRENNMKSFEFSKKRIQSIWIVIFLLVIITIGIIIGCGKLTEDEYPGSPVGTSGGTIALPVGPQSSWGTYSLTVWAHPPILPADGVSYAIVKAQLEDTSGRSLENFLISFNTISSDMACQFMVPPNQPGGTSSFSSTIQGRTGENGKVSVLLYGMQGGSCVVQATIDIDEDGTEDLFTTTNLTISGGPGVPGPGLPGVYLTADNTYKSENVGTCGEDTTEIEFTLYADVWDQTGIKVGAGVRVEFYEAGVLIGWAETDASGRATVTTTSGTLFPTSPAGVSISRTITAQVEIGGETYTDTVTITALATCSSPTPTPVPSLTVTADPVTLSVASIPPDPNITVLQACTSDSAAGVPVTFALSPTATVTGTFNTTTATTDASGCTPVGAVTFTVTGPAVGGTATITGTATGYTSGSSPTITVSP